MVQGATWSSYKNRHTLKLLIGFTPNGALPVVSKVYGGCISDKELTKSCGLLEKLQPEDTIMADRGFDLDDCLPDRVKFNVPQFLGSRQQLEPDEVVRTSHTATLRIYVERAIERVKKFQITHFFPAMLCPLAEHIIFVCTFLVLFEDAQVLCLP